MLKRGVVIDVLVRKFIGTEQNACHEILLREQQDGCRGRGRPCCPNYRLPGWKHVDKERLLREDGEVDFAETGEEQVPQVHLIFNKREEREGKLHLIIYQSSDILFLLQFIHLLFHSLELVLWNFNFWEKRSTENRLNALMKTNTLYK